MNYEPRDVTQDEKDFLGEHGFVWQGGWLFTCDGKEYDLSAADITQIETIRYRGLFVIPAPAAQEEA